MTSLRIGPLVYVRYLDHVLFRDANPGAYGLFTREAIGWLDHEDNDCIRLVWERFAVPDPHGEAKQKETGLVILKSAILEIRRLCGENYLNLKEHSIHHEYKGKTEDWCDPGNARNTPATAPVWKEGGDLQRGDKPPAG
jgi:hypothetical protein